jgi:hypothetical protein
MRALALCLVLAAFLPAVALGNRSASGTTVAACGSPSRVGSFGRVGRGAALGPLVVAFNDGAGRAEKVYITGFPTRVAIRGRMARRGDLTLRGYKCGSGRPLRFWYRNEPLTFPLGFPTTEQELQQKGDLSVKFPATKKLGGTYSGYMLFWAPGDWRLVLSGAGRATVGSVVVRVSEQSVG